MSITISDFKEYFTPFYKEITDYSIAATGVQGTASLIGFSAAKIWGEHAGAEFAPTHVCIPVIIYLGNSA